LQEETETPQEMFAKIDKVTLEDVNRVAKRVLVKEKVNLAMIGPLKEEEKFLELIS